MSWKILVTARPFETAGDNGKRMLEAAGCEIVATTRDTPLTRDSLSAELTGVDAVIAGSDDFSEATLALPEAADLKLITRWGVGYDAIDIAAATRRGIVVGFLPGYLDHAVADYTWALLLGAARRIPEGHHSVTHGGWEPAWGHDIHHRTLGIIGCGRIGLEVARRAVGFQMRVIARDPMPSAAAREAGVDFVGLETLLAESDFVSVNAAATPENRDLINEAALRQMKPTAILINTGRGSLIDEAALVRALQGGWIGGAALDAFAEEPLPVDHPLRSAPNALLCPHMAPFARGTGQELNAGVAQSVLDLMAGKKPKLVVNPEVFDSTNLRASMGVPA
jgi:phosphoglycerate dehydrogenase-like enzyme